MFPRVRLVRFVATTLVFALVNTPAVARRRTPPSTPAPIATPVPMPSPTSLSEAVRFERMRAALTAIARDAPGRLGIAVLDLASGERFAIRGDEAFALASVVKVPIAIVAYRLADQKKVDLNARTMLARADYRRGPSDIVDAHPTGGGTYAMWELIRAMIARSDNTASDVVLRAVGGPPVVDQIVRRLNVKGFTIRRSEAELAADLAAKRGFARGGENAGTPNAVAELFAGLATQRFTLVDATNELLLDLDLTSTGPSRLRAGLPANFRLAHKTGTSGTIDGVADATNDAGIVTLPDGRRVVVVALLAGSRAEEAAREATLASVARAVADAYAP